MIAKIISSTKSTRDFGAVRYATAKEKKGQGELMKIKNFPSFLTTKDNPDVFKNYLKSISNQNKKIDKPQFHSVISCNKKEYSKEELTDVADKWLEKMGYSKQPYLIVYHSDTENNHIHIVSTRVSQENFLKIDDSFEKLKSLTAIREVMKEKYNIDIKVETKDKLFDYNYESLGQLKAVLDKYDIYYKEDELGGLETKNSVGEKYNYSAKDFERENTPDDDKRRKQIKAIMYKYKDELSTQVYRTKDAKSKIEYHSQFQKELQKKFGLEIIFHTNEKHNRPFGYTVLDHKNNKTYKGSEIMKMNMVFDFTDTEISKTLFDILEKTNVTDDIGKKALIDKYQLQDFLYTKEPKSIRADKKIYSYRKYDNCKDYLKDNHLEIMKYKDSLLIYDKQKNTIFNTDKLFNNSEEFKAFYEGEPIEQKFKFEDEERNSVISHTNILNQALGVLGSANSESEKDFQKNKKKRKTKGRTK